MNTIVVATKNKGKIVEIKKLLDNLDVQVLSMTEAGIDIDVVEDGKTFEENALLKAKEISRHTDCVVLADDSGLEVDFLDGAPGVYSARFGGPGTTDDINNEKLLAMLEGVPMMDRTARFVCAIAVVFPDGRHFIVRDTCEGYVYNRCVGDNGFGYDSLFYLPQFEKTMAQIDMETKNIISHRAKALNKMAAELKKFILQKQ